MKKIYLIVLMAFAFGVSMAQSIFTNPITGTPVPGATVNPYTTGQIVNPNITVSGIGRGIGVTGGDANNRYNASSWNTVALDPDAYYEFTITPNASIDVSFISFVVTLQNSGTGPNSYALRSSIDAFAGDIGALVSSGTGAANTIDLSAAPYQSISAAITFRIYGWGASAAAGTFSVNDFTFNGVTNVLPISVEYFDGIKQNSANLISWKVNCTSSKNSTLTIERSADGRNFNNINSIVADGLRCLQPFSYTDNSPLAGYNYYRLKMLDENGRITYSNRIVVLNKSTGFDIINMVPTVVASSSTLNVTAAQKMQITVQITDLTGRLVQKNAYNLIAGSNQLKLNVPNLAAGTYQVTTYTAHDEVKTVRFVKQ